MNCPHCGREVRERLGLTPRQRELLDFIESEIEHCGRSPSFREMALAIGARSKSQVHRLVARLEERGYIARRAGSARSIEVIV